MIKRFKQSVLTSLLIASLGLSYNAQAAIKIYVKNCADTNVKVETFDAKDGEMSFAYQTKNVSPNESKKMKCKGQGKGFCNVITCNGSKGTAKKVKKNKWIKMESCTAYEKNFNSEPNCD